MKKSPIILFENTLRQLFIKLIGSDDDSNYKVTEQRINAWKEKREIERKKYKGTLIEDRIIYYSDFYDLRTIIHKNWEIFSPIFIEKKRFDIFFNEIEKFRNTLSHGRELTSSQENLMNGIVDDTRNQITIYHNKNIMKEDYFIQIISINDNFGNSWPNINENIILRVGDIYELIIDANDPKDREIQYYLYSIGGKINVPSQSNNKISFEITNQMISQNTSLLVCAFTPNSDYENKTHVTISLTILPSK
ncbi:hypothetical protein [Mesonia mobilis]|uniref:Swt1-like HEPN domain-containing protein n=1 Tax=Mesonia mobilis TaxID=369791 RepID=A0ABQ3BNJ7_9FLAO|nr:hypothetical protein [Mesonia mobilis]MBQ0739666.1 hypothetical protein [Aquimarina celericrescens]GGZ48439.1 hypothetical protein GCM10008088_07070 [Mesonia mobilis]